MRQYPEGRQFCDIARSQRAIATMSVKNRYEKAHFLLWHLGLPTLLAFGLFELSDYTELDRGVTDLFYAPAVHAFPLRHEWFLEIVMHQWAKYLLVLLACGVLSGFLLSFAVDALRPARRSLLFVLLALTLAPASVSWLRNVADKHCPYDTEIYGGFAPYERLLDAPTPGVKPGRCWPSAHAAGGFSLFAFYFLWRRYRPRRAVAALGVALLYGALLGVGRVMQGALFLSYAIWSAVIVWFVILILYAVLLARAEGSDTWSERLDPWRA